MKLSLIIFHLYLRSAFPVSFNISGYILVVIDQFCCLSSIILKPPFAWSKVRHVDQLLPLFFAALLVSLEFSGINFLDQSEMTIILRVD